MTENEKLDLILSTMQRMQQDMDGMQQELTALKLHIENVTDRNIQLLTENHIDLIRKLNEAIPVADKNLAYEVKVNYLLERVEILENDVAGLKSKTA